VAFKVTALREGWEIALICDVCGQCTVAAKTTDQVVIHELFQGKESLPPSFALPVPWQFWRRASKVYHVCGAGCEHTLLHRVIEGEGRSQVDVAEELILQMEQARDRLLAAAPAITRDEAVQHALRLLMPGPLAALPRRR
jgi:hypothetical protein